MGVLPTRLPRQLPSWAYPPCTRRITRHARCHLRTHVTRDQGHKLGICPTAPPMCRRCFPSASRRGTGRNSCIRFRGGANTEISQGLATRRSGRSGAIYVLHIAYPCQCRRFPCHTVFTLLRQGVPDVFPLCPKSRRNFLPLSHFSYTRSYSRRPSLPGYSIAPGPKYHWGQPYEISSRRIRC
jgi:hypothetical protein